ncbi:MAG: tetratricopeptide repeat protein [Candidatus Midichloria sp.]|nr:tetratricopeptide repeat protein [Candidatus Midichloria sp.]
MDIYQKIFKEDNKDIADAYNNIASAHYLQNDHDKVLIMLQKSLDIQLKISRENSREVATIYTNLHLLYQAQGNEVEAQISTQ